MNIKIDLIISASPELLNALSALAGGKTVVVAEGVAPVLPVTAEIVEVKKTRTKKVDTAVPVETGKQPDGAMEIGTTIEEIKTDLTQEMIIADAVPKSKAGHKDKIKAKVTELGYESITDLQPVHFNEFYAFLQTIPKPA